MKTDFQTAIQYKQGPVLDEDTAIKTTQNLPKLIEIYEEKFKGKCRDKSKPFGWTAKEEAELHDLIHGNIPNYKETMIYNNGVAEQVEFFVRKLENLPFPRRLEI